MGEDAAERIAIVGAGRERAAQRAVERGDAPRQRAVVAQQGGGEELLLVGSTLAQRGGRRQTPPCGRLPAECRAALPQQGGAAPCAEPRVAQLEGEVKREVHLVRAEGDRGLEVASRLAQTALHRRCGRLDARQRAPHATQQRGDAALELERPAPSGLQGPCGVVVHPHQVDVELLPLPRLRTLDGEPLRLREVEHVGGEGERAPLVAEDAVQVVLHAVRGGRGALLIGVAAPDRGAEIAPRKVGREALAEVEALGVGLQPEPARGRAVA